MVRHQNEDRKKWLTRRYCSQNCARHHATHYRKVDDWPFDRMEAAEADARIGPDAFRDITKAEVEMLNRRAPLPFVMPDWNNSGVLNVPDPRRMERVASGEDVAPMPRHKIGPGASV